MGDLLKETGASGNRRAKGKSHAADGDMNTKTPADHGISRDQSSSVFALLKSFASAVCRQQQSRNQ